MGARKLYEHFSEPKKKGPQGAQKMGQVMAGADRDSNVVETPAAGETGGGPTRALFLPLVEG